jgi:SNF2 family DNA or RNA helicase
MAAALEVALLPARATVRIVRRDIDDTPWLAVRALWNADGPDATTRIDVTLETFMANRFGLVHVCRDWKIDVQLDAGMRHMAQRAKTTSEKLIEAGASPTSRVSPDEIASLLAATRFKRVLRAFQIRDLGRLLALESGANFSVPGAGKTAVALALYEIERGRRDIQRLLVIAPLSAFDSWSEELAECLSPIANIEIYAGGEPSPLAEIVLVNYQRLASNYDYLAAWVRDHNTMVILDEAHRMKRGWAGEWGTACLNLAFLAARRDVLTGTPAPQGPSDLVAILDYLWPNDARQILPGDALVANPGPDSGKRVADAIRPFFVRTNKEDLKLPPVSHRSIVVPLEGLHRDIYESLRDNYRGTLDVSRRDQLDLVAMGRVTMYLLEAATNPKLLSAGSLEGEDADVFRHPPLPIEPGSRLADLIATYNLHETPRKFEELLKLLKTNADLGRKTLVWSNFVRNLKTLQRMLTIYQPALIHGGIAPFSTDPTEITRHTEIGRFRREDGCKVLLANPAAMSEGISLHHACHDAVYLERTFNAGQFIQSVDRIHRLGLGPDQETRVTFLLTDHTIDQIVDRRVELKARRLGEMVDDPNLAAVVLPSDEDYGGPIDDGLDIAALFAHLRGEDAA